MSVEIRSLLHNEGETRAFGHHLGTLLRRGDWVALIGTLGSGKTTLVQGIVDGVHPGRRGRSPTYVMVEVYGEGPRIVHADLYRMARPAEIETLGLTDLAEGDAVVLVEWADRALEHLPEDRLELDLRYVPEGGREIRIRPRGPRWEDVAREGHLDRDHWSHALYPRD
ncbi:MAG TPA: tRNA (adenosine(37)-N6)-threonylcarbamoyltransferase complex ATPase subunit type 1 TsaE [Candidatus Limnocylindrales bacterium]|nr:tRNA (adenosine(37)-N6)-threonylcarbamoyltransferase complex ATPase subunit type 1 TsaE [Candidatus Limnocylindrales bacterium]